MYPFHGSSMSSGKSVKNKQRFLLRRSTQKAIIVLLLHVFVFCIPAFAETTKNKSTVQPFSSGKSRTIYLQNLSYPPAYKQIVTITGTGNPVFLKIEVTSETGEPLSGVSLKFSILDKPSDKSTCHFSESLITTGENGIAQTNFYPGVEAGLFFLSVRAVDFNVEPLTIRIKGISRDWVKLLFFGLFGGMAMFLYGMVLGSRGLQKVAGTQMRTVVGKLTNNRLSGTVIGAAVSGILQSSSAATVMVVSLVSASLLTLRQALGVIIGANIGTAVTVHLIAFEITTYALLMIGIGFGIRLFSTKKRAWHLGQVIMGFGFIFYGMHIMSLSVEPLRHFPQFMDLLLLLKNYPFLMLVLALIFTAIVQSSSVAIGLSIIFAREGLMTLDMAMPIVWGAHIGTTSTALLASFGSNTDGKRIALFHIFFNVCGSLLFFFLRNPFVLFIEYISLQYISDSIPRMIANANMIYLVATGILFIFFVGPFSILLKKITYPSEKNNGKDFGPKYLSTSLLNTPELALDHALREVLRMASYVEMMLEMVMQLILRDSSTSREKILDIDDKVDILEEAVRKYLVLLSQRDISAEQSKRAVALLYIADDIEHMGDVIEIGLMSSAVKLGDSQIDFSPEGKEELKKFHLEILTMFRTIVVAIRKEDRKFAAKVHEMKGSIKQLERELRKSHLDRLLKGRPESIESGTIHMDIIGDLRRISTLSSKIAHTIIEEF